MAALDATTGKEIWVRDIPGPGQPSLRGVEYWPGDGQIGPRIVFGTRDGRLIALDAATGAWAAGFGYNGVVDMKTADVMNDMPKAQLGLTTPPIVYRNLIITGSSVQETPALGAAGDVRAWDARSGKLVWTFHTVPRPGERGYDSWAPGSTQRRSGVNVWGFLSLDEKRGIVYLPIAAPAVDRYGEIASATIFSAARSSRSMRRRVNISGISRSCIMTSGTLSSNPHRCCSMHMSAAGRCPPSRWSPKNALLFMLDRVTGEPIHPVEERPVPPSTVPG